MKVIAFVKMSSWLKMIGFYFPIEILVLLLIEYGLT